MCNILFAAEVWHRCTKYEAAKPIMCHKDYIDEKDTLSTPLECLSISLQKQMHRCFYL